MLKLADWRQEELIAEIERLRSALHEIVTNGRWSIGEQCGEWCVSKDVYDIAYNADLLTNSPRKWRSGRAYCGACEHKWVAVAPVEARALECPKCKQMEGFFE
jgi:hypothetical protein